MQKLVSFFAVFLFFLATSAHADPMMDDIATLQHAWAKGYYSTPENRQEDYFASLRNQAHQVSEKFPGKAEPLIWEGIITSTLAKYQSIFSAGGTAKDARDLLLEAIRINPDALDGSALTSLGSLYYKVPRFGSFGDYDKAREYLERALKVDPNGIDQNYFYGEFLSIQGDKAGAIAHLKKALAAPPRPGRADADAGRRNEIRQLLDKLSK
ncbi:MAG: tetratricopeptide repeat protein [Burkholderiales bacterium]|nr:tetratricopeptide repeat protein [Burkholderiales bacterium]